MQIGFLVIYKLLVYYSYFNLFLLTLTFVMRTTKAYFVPIILYIYRVAYIHFDKLIIFNSFLFRNISVTYYRYLQRVPIVTSPYRSGGIAYTL